MRIIVDKLSTKCDLDNERMVVDIPDDQLLRLGKKYFELASKGEKEENPYYLTDEDMLVCARKLKTYCDGCANCARCVFCANPDLNDGGGIYRCKLDHLPANWEV